MTHISIHALLAESDRFNLILALCHMISIHALLAESDISSFFDCPISHDISIHALLAESDLDEFRQRLRDLLFLSTLSLRRATLCYQRLYRLQDISIHALLAESDRTPGPGSADQTHFYPRSPCGERRL